jgi:hypothetical protein
MDIYRVAREAQKKFSLALKGKENNIVKTSHKWLIMLEIIID